MKKLICIALVILMTAALFCIAPASTAALNNEAKITVGGNTYTFAVGDYFTYTISFKYTGNDISTAQIELPIDFSFIESYSQQELDAHMDKVAPAAPANAVAQRYYSQLDNTLGITGYVMNFVTPNSITFKNGRAAMTLLFRVNSYGTYNLAAKVRYVDDADGNTVVDKNYNITDNRFSYTESLSDAQLDTPAPRVSSAAGGMLIEWDPVPLATTYRVYYKGRNGWTKLTDTNETSFLDDDVVSGTRYTYTVRCLSVNGSGFASSYDPNGKSAYYYTAPVLSLSNAEDGVNIRWDAVSGVAKYRVYYRGRNGWTRMVDTAGTSYVDTDVSSGTNYTYTIRCLDSSGNFLSGFYSDGFRITFLSAPSFSLSNAPDGVKISWDAVKGAAKYRVFYYGSRGWTRLIDTAETSFVDTDVSSNHTYKYTVRCISEDGATYTSDFRAGKSIKYIAAPILILSNAEDAVSIRWNAVSGAAKYRVYYRGRNGWTKLTETSGTSFVDSDVSSGTNYTYTIRCLDSSGNFNSNFYSDGFKITFLSAPSFSLSNAPDGVKISWSAVKGAAKYRVFYYGSKGWTRLTDTAETSFVDTDVSSNHTYKYTVRCISEDGTTYTSDFRAGKSIKFFAAPTLNLTSAQNGVNISWNAVSGSSKYRVYRKTASGWSRLTETSGTSFVDTGVTSGTKYTYTIRCLDSSGNFISDFYADGFSITYTK